MIKYIIIILLICTKLFASITDELTKLSDMYKEGLLTKEEFTKAKSILLEIEEIGGNGSGSNEWFDKCLGKLYFSQKLGKFNIHTDKLSTIEKNFATPINLNSSTIRIRNPNGDIWEDESKLSLTIELKITTQKKPINQLSLNTI